MPSGGPTVIKCSSSLALVSPKDLFRWSPSADLLACVQSATLVGVYTPSWEHICTYRDIYSHVHALEWSLDGRALVACCMDGSTHVWQARTGARWLKQTSHNAAVRAVAWSRNSKAILSASADGALKLFDPRSGRSLQRLAGHRAGIGSVAWSADNSIAASFADDGELRIWNVQTGSPTSIQLTPGSSIGMAAHPSDKVLACITATGIAIVDIAVGRVVRVIETPGCSQVSLSPTGELMGVLSHDGSLALWNVQNWQRVAMLEAEGRRPVTFFSFLSDGTLFGVDRAGKTISLWRVTQEQISTSTVATTKQYKTAKVALVGDNGVGKTGLGWRLAHREFREHASTHGQQFWVLNDVRPTTSDTESDAVLWDFAGQQDYRIIHSLFLDDVDVALILFDPTHESEPLKGVEFWLQQISAAGAATCKKILVGARIDRGALTITDEEVRDFVAQHRLDGFVSTSARTGEGVNALVALISRAIPWEAIPSVVTTEVFDLIKKRVLSLKECANEGDFLLPLSQLATDLVQLHTTTIWSIDIIHAALASLADHGFVTQLRRADGEQMVLLSPDLLINLASSMVLEARRNPSSPWR
jgi:small GTP-binding protein